MRSWCVLFVAACSSVAPTPVQPVAVTVADAPIDAPIDAPPDASVAELAILEYGAQLFQTQGCIACHSLDGTFRIGPSLLGDWGTTIALDDGTQVIVDEAYVRESIRDPQAKKRAGFAPVMPVFTSRLTPEDVDALVIYIKSLR